MQLSSKAWTAWLCQVWKPEQQSQVQSILVAVFDQPKLLPQQQQLYPVYIAVADYENDE